MTHPSRKISSYHLPSSNVPAFILTLSLLQSGPRKLLKEKNISPMKIWGMLFFFHILYQCLNFVLLNRKHFTWYDLQLYNLYHCSKSKYISTSNLKRHTDKEKLSLLLDTTVSLDVISSGKTYLISQINFGTFSMYNHRTFFLFHRSYTTL